MCLSLCVPVFASPLNGMSFSRDYKPQAFRVREVIAYPAYYNSDDGLYYYNKGIYRRSIDKDRYNQYNWLKLTSSTKQSLLSQFAETGTPATHWFIKVTCDAENIPNILRYEHHSLQGGATISVRGFNSTTTFNFTFPVQNTSSRYYDGITGGLYYHVAESNETSFGFAGTLALDSTFSDAI